MPIRPSDGRPASSTNPDDWGTFDQAMAAVSRFRLHGVGVVLGDGLAGADFDTCRDRRTGELAPWAQSWIKRLASYAEVSPSGEGVKVLAFVDPLTDLRANKRTMGDRANGGDHPPAIEIYTGARYFTLTGEHLGETPDEITDATPAFERLGAFVAEGRGGRSEAEPGTAIVRDLLAGDERLRKAWNTGEKLGGGGDDSRSAHDFALAVYLARRGVDPASIEAVLRVWPHGQIGGGALAGVNARRRIDRLLREAAEAVVKAKSRSTTEGNPATDEPTLILDPTDPYPCALRFLEKHHTGADGLLLRHHRGDFYRHAGTHWPVAEDAVIRREVYRYLAGAGRVVGNRVLPVKPTSAKVNDFLDALKAAALLEAGTTAPGWIASGTGHTADELVPMKNGLLHLPTGELLPPTPKFFNNNVLPFDYDPATQEPKKWLAFLDSVWPDDQEASSTLQEEMGYLVSGDRRQQKVFLHVGPPRSGKGTIGRIIHELLGRENVAGPTLADLANNFGLAPLIGKSVAVISDARLSGRSDAAVIAERLLSISGEDAITIDRKHREHWTGTLPTRFVLLTNELPRIADASGALASRFVILTMTRSFLGREDQGLFERLKKELPAIFNWAVQGWRRLAERGRFVMPESSAAAVEDIEALSSPILAFLKASCRVEPGARVECREIYDRWCRWCEAQGRREPGTTQTFGRDLRAAVPGLKITHPRVEGVPTRFYEGVGLRVMRGDARTFHCTRWQEDTTTEEGVVVVDNDLITQCEMRASPRISGEPDDWIDL
jgi:putative DNA primase/helicase